MPIFRRGALILCLTAAGCYQTPEWADPIHWTKTVAAEVKKAADEAKRRAAAAANRQEAGNKEAEPVVEAMPPTGGAAAAAPVKRDPVKQEMSATKQTPSTGVKPTKQVPATAKRTTNPAKPRHAPHDSGSGFQTVTPPMPAAPREPVRAEPMATDPSPGPVAAKPAPATATTPDVAEFAVHLASYRHMASLRSEWSRMARAHPEYLMGLKARVATVDLGPKRGKYHRLKVGPLPTQKFAERLCRSLKLRGLYCAVVQFTGRGLAAAASNPDG